MIAPIEIERIAQNLHALSLDPVVHFSVVCAIGRALDQRPADPAHAADDAVKPRGKPGPKRKPQDGAWSALRPVVAASLKQRGQTHDDLATALDVAGGTVRMWLYPTGRPPGPAMLQRIRQWLEQPAQEVPAPVATFPGNGHAEAA